MTNVDFCDQDSKRLVFIPQKNIINLFFRVNLPP